MTDSATGESIAERAKAEQSQAEQRNRRAAIGNMEALRKAGNRVRSTLHADVLEHPDRRQAAEEVYVRAAAIRSQRRQQRTAADSRGGVPRCAAHLLDDVRALAANGQVDTKYARAAIQRRDPEVEVNILEARGQSKVRVEMKKHDPIDDRRTHCDDVRSEERR